MRIDEQVLGIEQMRELEKLGLYTSDSSLIYATYPNPNPNFKDRSPILCKLFIKDSFAGLIDGIDYVPAYTISDIVEKLPARIESNGVFYNLSITKYEDYYIVGYSSLYGVQSKSKLEAVHQLLLWCIKNGYLK